MNVTVKLSEAQSARLNELADYHGVSVTKLVMESAERILEEDAAILAAVEEGRASIARGEVHDQDELFAELYARIDRETASAAG
jgi:predicted transcriptional regulator